MPDDFLLLNPGPVPVSESVLSAMREPMISHRSASFEEIYERAKNGLEYIFTRSTLDETPTANTGTPIILNGTATMGMEAAIANLVSRDSTVLALNNGKFGRRFARIADRYCSVERYEIEWGDSFEVDAVAEKITDEIDVVTMVHNETSTGISNPVKQIGELAQEVDAYFVIDGVTSIGGDEFRIDEWNVDVAITDAQKALASPPGISAMYATERAIDAFDGEQAPFYEDLDWYVQKVADNQTPFTSAVPLFRGLAVAVEEIEEEGMPNRIRRHRRQSAAMREGFKAMGLSLFPTLSEAATYSRTVTAVELPSNVQSDPEAFFDAVNKRKVSISGGQAHLSGEIFRVSNMGKLTDEQILRGVRTVGNALDDLGEAPAIDAAVTAAKAELE